MSASVWPALLGRFTWQDLPFVRAWQNPTVNELIGAGAAGMVVFGAVAVAVLLTVTGRWRWLWSEWLTSLAQLEPVLPSDAPKSPPNGSDPHPGTNAMSEYGLRSSIMWESSVWRDGIEKNADVEPRG